MNHNQKIGKLGQQIAIKFLKGKDYIILDQNIYFREGEIDILAEKNHILRFIEVKTRTNLKFGYPEEAISENKKEHLKAAINRYIEKNKVNQEYRLEIISIVLDIQNKKADIKFFN